MCSNYRMKIDQSDPEISMALPSDMVNDLCRRAEENGQSFSVELLVRLARTLEVDDGKDASYSLLEFIFQNAAIQEGDRA